MTDRKRHPEGVYERWIVRGGRRARVFDVVYEAPRLADGKRRMFMKRGFPTQRDAVGWRDRQRVGVRSGGHVAPDRATVGTYLLDEWLPSIRSSVRPGTWSSYSMHCRVHVAPRIGHVRLQTLTVEQVDKTYADLLADGLSAASVRRVHSTVRRALRDARKSGRIVANVAELATLPKASRPKMMVWTPAEARTFLMFVLDRDEQSHALFSLMLATGLRRGEAVGLRWSNLDLDGARLTVERTLVSIDGRIAESEPKSERSHRTIGLDPETVAILRRQRARQSERRLAWGEAWKETDLVFDRGDGGELHPDAISKRFAKLAREAGVPAIRLHDLRHTAATLMLTAGVPAKVASERLGHSTIAITLDTYTAFVPSLDEDAAARTASLIYGSG
ncbi:MAG: tyrosine-type recombinase/integrase [Actinomycetota bacterium]